MEIKTRRQAMADGENKYFTGKPCKHGHMNFRYVQSGACYDCINSDRINAESPTAKAREERLKAASEKLAAKNLIVEQMVIGKFRLFEAFRETLSLAAYGMAAMRFPTLTQSDVDPKLAPSGREPAGSAMYSFYCHPDDVAALRALENQLMRGNGSGEAARRAVHGDRIASVPVAVVPDWAREPRPGDPDYK